MSSEKDTIKKAVKRVMTRKYFWRHFLVFVVGNFLLFFLSLSAWIPAIFYFLTLIWMRLLAYHFTSAYPSVTEDFKLSFHEPAEDYAIDQEIKKIEKGLDELEGLPLKSPKLNLKTILRKDYEDGDLV